MRSPPRAAMPEKRPREEDGAGKLSAAEKRVYDRQLRVWGVDTQVRLSKSQVLVLGAPSLLAAETCKNVVLAGVGKLVVLDDTPLDSAERPVSRSANYLVNAAMCNDGHGHATYGAALQRSLQELNPLVSVRHESAAASDVAEHLKGVSLVLAFGLEATDFGNVAKACRSAGVPHYLGGSCGGFAFWFNDLGDEVAYEAEGKDAGKTCTKSFVPLATAMKADWKSLPRRACKGYALLRALFSAAPSAFRKGVVDADAVLAAIDAQACKDALKPDKEKVRAWIAEDVAPNAPECEDVAVCSVAGGVLANEVLKSISRKGEPAANFYFYGTSILNGAGVIEKVGL